MAPEAANYLFNDIVVVEGSDDEGNGGQPVKSFTVQEDTDGVISLAKAFITDRKIAALKNGDTIPKLTIGRVCVDLNSPYPHRAWIDYNFQKSQIGMAPTPNPKARGGLVPA